MSRDTAPAAAETRPTVDAGEGRRLLETLDAAVAEFQAANTPPTTPAERRSHEGRYCEASYALEKARDAAGDWLYANGMALIEQNERYKAACEAVLAYVGGSAEFYDAVGLCRAALAPAPDDSPKRDF